MAETDRTSIPDKPDLKEGSLPKQFGSFNNLAGDEKLVKQFRQWAYKQFLYFKGQDQRKKFVDNGGIMDKADRMYRVALNRDTASAQHQNTLSDVASTMYFRQVRTVTAGEIAVFFSVDDTLPAEYKPEINTTEYTMTDGEDIATQQNILEAYTFDEDKRKEKIKDILLRNNKYGQAMVSIEWDHRAEEIEERIPTKVDPETGKPIAFKFETRTRVVADWPSLIEHDLQDCYFDAQLDDMRKQRCFLKANQRAYEEYVAQQSAGFIMNVGKLSAAQLYSQDESENMERRLANSEENATTEPTGLFREWQVFGVVPIKETGDGKGKWDHEKTVPTLYWATFAGDISSDNAVCLRLRKFDEIPYKLLHSHRDDKGAYHMGYASILSPLYWQVTTNMNQAVDNVTMRNKAPWTADGPVLTRDLTFRQNRLIKTARGVSLKRVDVPDTTGITLALHDKIETDADKTAGTDRPILGEPLGSRTSATEAKQVYDQATLPLDDKTSYVADQIFPWMFERDAKLWRKWGDPDVVLSVSHNQEIKQVMPGKLYGPLKTKVTAVSRFKNNLLRRQEINGFIQSALPSAAPVMGQQGSREFWRQTFKIFGFENVPKLVPEDGDYDARSRQLQEIHMIMNVGQWVEPSTMENHDAHIAVLDPLIREYELLPEYDVDAERLRMLRAHLQIHKNFVAESQAQLAQVGGGEQARGLPGEIAGNFTEAQEGALSA